MNPYRIKHVPTGLYYKPGAVNLSKNGKVYMSEVSVLSTREDHIFVHVSTGSKLRKDTEDKIKWESSYYDTRRMFARIPKNEFTKEPI